MESLYRKSNEFYTSKEQVEGLLQSISKVNGKEEEEGESAVHTKDGEKERET